MWESPHRTLPALHVPVVAITNNGDLLWVKRTPEGWFITDSSGFAAFTILSAEPFAWIHQPPVDLQRFRK